MSKNFTDRFQDASDVFHRQYRPSEISVDWDAYTKNRENPDETCPIAYIKTDRFSLTSCSPKHSDLSHQILWGDQEVVKNFQDGTIRDVGCVREIHTNWESRWEGKNPFSGFAVYTGDRDEFFASIWLSPPDHNSTQLGYLSAKKMHGKKYGKEYIGAIVFDWSRWIVEHNHQLPLAGDFLNIFATAHVDNVPSNKILADLGFQKGDSPEKKYGEWRNYYELPVCVAGDLMEGDA